MKIEAIYIPASPPEPLRLVEIDNLSVDDYRDLVEGPIELIHLYDPQAALYINEDGKLNQLPVNERATAIAWMHNEGFRRADFIVGNAFIVGGVTRHGEDKSVPDKLKQLLLEPGRFQVEARVQGEARFHASRTRFNDWFVAYIGACHLAYRRPEVEEVRVVRAAS